MTVEWSMLCDAAGCEAKLVAQARNDDAAIVRLHELARANDWSVTPSPYGWAGVSTTHLCALHTELQA